MPCSMEVNGTASLDTGSFCMGCDSFGAVYIPSLSNDNVSQVIGLLVIKFVSSGSLRCL